MLWVGSGESRPVFLFRIALLPAAIPVEVLVDVPIKVVVDVDRVELRGIVFADASFQRDGFGIPGRVEKQRD